MSKSNAPIGFADSKCKDCNGSGVVVIVVAGYESGHGCDGTQENCDYTCPVPIPTQWQEQDLCHCLKEFPYPNNKDRSL